MVLRLEPKWLRVRTTDATKKGKRLASEDCFIVVVREICTADHALEEANCPLITYHVVAQVDLLFNITRGNLLKEAASVKAPPIKVTVGASACERR
eukprot:4502935-Amphidinium_carterae.1